MGMGVAQAHAAVIHAPLLLLPAVAAVDLAAALRGDRASSRIGRTLWWAAVGSGLFAGLACMAASPEVRRRWEGHAALLAGVLGMATWRQRHRPRVGQALLGVLAAGAGLCAAYLGSEIACEAPRIDGGPAETAEPEAFWLSDGPASIG